MKIAAIGLAGALVLVACGDDDGGGGAGATLPPASDATTETTAATTATTAAFDGGDGFTYPTDADAVVVSYAEVGGLTTRAFAVQNLPRILITGDGRVLTPGATIAVFPGPLLPEMSERSISEDGVEAVLAAADAGGLFAEVDYSSEATEFVADAPTATVQVSADGATWEHSAYALGLGAGPGGGAETPERAALAEFVAQLGDLEGLVGADALGPEVVHEPSEYRVVAFPIDDPNAVRADGIEPTIVEWPADAPVRLADAEQCVLAPADEVRALFADADQLTFFSEDGIVYEVLPTPMLPGSSCS